MKIKKLQNWEWNGSLSEKIVFILICKPYLEETCMGGYILVHMKLNLKNIKLINIYLKYLLLYIF